MKYFCIAAIFLFALPCLSRAQESTLTGAKVDTVKDQSDAYEEKKVDNSSYFDDDIHRLSVFFGLSASVTTLGFNGAVSFPEGTTRNSFFPLVSAGVDLLLSKKTRRFIIRFEGSYKSNKYSFEDVRINAYTIANLRDFRQTTFTVSPQLIYNLDFIRTSPLFISAGASINGSIYNDHTYTRTFTLSNGISYTGAEKYPRFQRIWLSIPVKVGATINKNLQLYAGYSWYSTYSLDPLRFPARMNAYQAGFYYLFK